MQTLILVSTLALSLVLAIAAAKLALSLVLWLAAKGLRGTGPERVPEV